MRNDDLYYRNNLNNEYSPSNLNISDNLYSRDGFSPSATNRDASYYNTLDDNRNHLHYTSPVIDHNSSHYQSMDNVQINNVARVGRVLTKIMCAVLAVVIIFTVLGFMTDGSAVGFDKVDGVITDCQRMTGFQYSRTVQTRYRTTVKYTYKDKEYTMVGKSVYPKTVNKNVSIYISRTDSTQIYYFENTSAILSYISPFYIVICAILAFSFILGNQDKRTSRYFSDII